MQIASPGVNVSCLSNNGSSSILYFILADYFYAVNTSTGALVGQAVRMSPGLGIDAMFFDNGILYGVDSSNRIYSIDSISGVATYISTAALPPIVSGQYSYLNVITGLAPAPAPAPSATPEPCTMLLLGFGLIGMAGARRLK